MIDALPISERTWSLLVDANKASPWAQRGIFGTGIGPRYRPGGVLYVGKSAGPLSRDVGSGHNQRLSIQASTNWMVERKNRRSAFWHFIEKIDGTRQSLAWTNICKMDQLSGGKPPTGLEWERIAGTCRDALSEEIRSLAPKVVIFVTSQDYKPDISLVLASLGYRKATSPLDGDGWTSAFEGPNGTYAVTTRHPQGWGGSDREAAIEFIRTLL